MAALNPLLVYKDGDAHRVALYRLVGMTTGDTVDVGSEFKKVFAACVMPMSQNILNFPANPTILGTVLTIAQVSLASDAAYLLVTGASS